MQFPPTGVLTSKVSEANLLCLMMVVTGEASDSRKWIYMAENMKDKQVGEEMHRKERVGPCFSSH